jgi:uncharacterized integral membrane protein
VSNLPEKRPPEDGGSSWKPILLAVVLVYAVVFLLLNSDQVKISFVFFNARTSLLFLVLLSMAIGFVLGMFGPAWWRRRQRKRRDTL